ncbi:MAG: glycosyltransferase family 39 protein, partial [Candidatus Brocadiales bacterium]|nr:glycosyltransferase family 39 protein [Candidatus Brocadiales bacterium]
MDVEHVPCEPSAPGIWISGAETWRPLQYALHRLIYIGFGLDPLPYRLLSLVIYICALPLFYHLYNLLLENKTLSKVAVILFASYYLNNESVARIVMLSDLLLPLFCVSTLVCFIHYRKTSNIKYYVSALLLAFLAQQSKETAVTLPFSLLVVDYYISQGTFPPKAPSLTDVRRGLLPYLPFCLNALVTLVLIYARPGNPPFTHLY